MTISDERTLLLLKPDAVERRLVGTILHRVERLGLTVTDLVMRRATEAIARKHYGASDAQLRGMGTKLLAATSAMGVSVADELGTDDPVELGSLIFEGNIRYLTAGPVVAAAVQGPDAISKIRHLCGATLPANAALGTIRGDFGTAGVARIWSGDMTVPNLVHSSDSKAEATREITLWFPHKPRQTPSQPKA